MWTTGIETSLCDDGLALCKGVMKGNRKVTLTCLTGAAGWDDDVGNSIAERAYGKNYR